MASKELSFDIKRFESAIKQLIINEDEALEKKLNVKIEVSGYKEAASQFNDVSKKLQKANDALSKFYGGNKTQIKDNVQETLNQYLSTRTKAKQGKASKSDFKASYEKFIKQVLAAQSQGVKVTGDAKDVFNELTEPSHVNYKTYQLILKNFQEQELQLKSNRKIILEEARQAQTVLDTAKEINNLLKKQSESQDNMANSTSETDKKTKNLLDTITRLEDSLSTANSEFEKLKRQYEEQSAYVSELLEKQKLLQDIKNPKVIESDEYQQMVSDLEKAIGKVREYEQEIERLESLSNYINNQLSFYRSGDTVDKGTYDNLEKIYDYTRESLKKTQEEANEFSAQVTELTNKIDVYSQSYANLESNLSNEQKKNKDLTDSLKETSDRLNDLTQKYKELDKAQNKVRKNDDAFSAFNSAKQNIVYNEGDSSPEGFVKFDYLEQVQNKMEKAKQTQEELIKMAVYYNRYLEQGGSERILNKDGVDVTNILIEKYKELNSLADETGMISEKSINQIVRDNAKQLAALNSQIESEKKQKKELESKIKELEDEKKAEEAVAKAVADTAKAEEERLAKREKIKARLKKDQAVRQAKNSSQKETDSVITDQEPHLPSGGSLSATYQSEASDVELVTQKIRELEIAIGEKIKAIQAEQVAMSLASEDETKKIDEIRESVTALSNSLKEIPPEDGNLLFLLKEFDPNGIIANNIKEIVSAIESLYVKVGSVPKGLGKFISSIQELSKNSISHNLGEPGLDISIDNETNSLMEKWGISGKRAFEEIRESIVKYRSELKSSNSELSSIDDELAFFANAAVQSTNNIRDALLNNIKILDESKNDYKELCKYITEVNRSGHKIHIPQSVKNEYGDSFSSMRSSLGSAFTTSDKGGTDLEVWIEELNQSLGNMIDLSNGVESAFEDLYNKVKIGKEGKFFSGDELLNQGFFDDSQIKEMGRDIDIAVQSIDDAEEKLKSLSATANDTFDKNELNTVDSTTNSIIQFKDAIKDIDNLERITSIISSFSQNKNISSVLDNIAKSIENIKESLSDIPDGSEKFLGSLKDLTSQADALKDLATVISASKKQIEEIKEIQINDEDNWKDSLAISEAYSDAEKRIKEQSDQEKKYLKERKRLLAEGAAQEAQYQKDRIAYEKEYEQIWLDAEKERQNYNKNRISNEFGVSSKWIKSNAGKGDLDLTRASDDFREKMVNAREELQKCIPYMEKLENGDPITPEQFERIRQAVKSVQALNEQQKTDPHTKVANENSYARLLSNMEKYLSENTGMSKDLSGELDQLIDKLKNIGKYGTLGQIQQIGTEFEYIKGRVREAGQEVRSFWDTFTGRVQSMSASAIARYFSLYDVIRYAKEMATTAREYDSALTEMRKVSDESVESLKRYQQASFDLANQVGTTAKQLQQSTADFMRIGESLDDAAESAKVANILLNVSEFEDINEATESLVSMSQAFKELGKGEIIDVLNKLGNEFAISTDGLATALQNSASALKTAQNDFYESAALTTAANTIVQDPAKVGAGLRTIALRLTGTEYAKQELEELGEDVDDFVVTTSSKMNQSIMDLTKVQGKVGVSILDMNGNYRSTYEINNTVSINRNIYAV